MGYQPRILEKFESTDAATSYTFPDAEFEWRASQPLVNEFASIAGASYGYRYNGTAPAEKRLARESLSCSIVAPPGGTPSDVDTAYDEMKSELWKIGQGKIFTIDRSGVRRWAYASIAAMPDMRWSAGMIFNLALGIELIRESDWFGTTLISSSGTLGAAVVIDNIGNAPVYNAVLTLKGTYTNPIITNSTAFLKNSTLNYRLSSLRDGSNANHWLRYNAGSGEIEFASDATTFADDYANYQRQAGQVHLMRLDPGNNSIAATSGVSGSTTLAYSFYPAFH